MGRRARKSNRVPSVHHEIPQLIVVPGNNILGAEHDIKNL